MRPAAQVPFCWSKSNLFAPAAKQAQLEGRGVWTAFFVCFFFPIFFPSCNTACWEPVGAGHYFRRFRNFRISARIGGCSKKIRFPLRGGLRTTDEEERAMERTVTENTPDRLLRRTEVEKFCGISRSMIYALMRAGRFPTPIKISPRAVRWSQREIENWIAARPRATGGRPTP